MNKGVHVTLTKKINDISLNVGPPLKWERALSLNLLKILLQSSVLFK